MARIWERQCGPQRATAPHCLPLEGSTRGAPAAARKPALAVGALEWHGGAGRVDLLAACAAGEIDAGAVEAGFEERIEVFVRPPGLEQNYQTVCGVFKGETEEIVGRNW